MAATRRSFSRIRRVRIKTNEALSKALLSSKYVFPLLHLPGKKARSEVLAGVGEEGEVETPGP